MEEYHLTSPDMGLFVDAQGPIDMGFPPFLGAHMINDPSWKPDEGVVSTAETSPCLPNCEFQVDFTVMATKAIEEDEEILVNYGFEDNNSCLLVLEEEKKPAGRQEEMVLPPTKIIHSKF